MSLSTLIRTPNVTYEQPLGLFINNKFVKGVEGKTFETINPSTEKVITSVREATEKDVDVAVKAARAAFEGEWHSVTPSERGRLLVKLADLIERDSETLAAIEALDNGKTVAMAKLDVAAAAGCLRYYGGWADKIHGQAIDTNNKIGPAAAAGNTVVLKTAEQTPLSGLYGAKLIAEAGFPAGVVNIISGFGRTAGAAISSHMDIDKVAFTGSTFVGRLILQAAAKSNLNKVTVELGGKSPNIVFDDADIDNAISWANFGIFYTHGQRPDLLIAKEDIFGPVVAITKFKDKAEAIRIGNDSNYGLAAGIHTQNVNTAIRVSNALEVG
ncbi:hypothetical protein PVAR5_9024 [Paecilomyces variotii No. 5]|uniref:aldehyde dehydrogenase (NAD(+)) n=1 Tax=Byssochlamys spectabilis (strain No. 5 / NBRC 109023) TaxID=1356009 RepID=V5GH60_BYSSN|nr:hypothetical protein PVAR5_9024 [Paecilomyces variotii No. 5]